MTESKVLRPDENDLVEAVIRGSAGGGSAAATLGAIGQAGNLLLTTDKMTKVDKKMVQSMIDRVERVNPDLIIKELLPLKTKNPIEGLIDKYHRRQTGFFDPRSFNPSPEKYWKPKDKVLQRARDMVDAAWRPKIVAPGDAATMLHELGHAEHLAGKSPLSVAAARTVLPAAMSALGGYAAAKGHEDLAPFIAAAGTVPLLYQELQASGRAVKHMYKTQGIEAAARGLAKLAPAFLTYAALPVGIYYGVKAALGDLDKRNTQRAEEYKELFEKKSHILYGSKNSHVLDGFLSKLEELLG